MLTVRCGARRWSPSGTSRRDDSGDQYRNLGHEREPEESRDHDRVGAVLMAVMTVVPMNATRPMETTAEPTNRLAGYRVRRKAQ